MALTPFAQINAGCVPKMHIQTCLKAICNLGNNYLSSMSKVIVGGREVKPAYVAEVH